jgi:FkbM family methyltransferase
MEINVPLLQRHGVEIGEAYERLLEVLIDELLRPGAVAVDGGANTGRHTPRMARRVAPTGRVFAFEPQPEVCEANRSGVERLGLSQCVKYYAAALGQKSGKATFFVAEQTHPFSSLSRRFVTNTLRNCGRETEAVTEATVDVLALDSMREIRRLDLLKLDVEGAEFLAMRGARKLLASSDCFVYWEGGRGWAGELFGYGSDEFFDFFEDIGYEPHTAFGKELRRNDWTDPQLGWYCYAHRSNSPRRAAVERVVGRFWTDLIAARIESP